MAYRKDSTTRRAREALRQHGPMSYRALAQAIGVPQKTLVDCVRKAERRGMWRITPDRMVVLSDAARTEEMWQAEILERRREGMRTAQTATVYGLAATVAAALRAMPPGQTGGMRT